MAVAVVHALIGFLLLAGLGSAPIASVDHALKVFAPLDPPPPPAVKEEPPALPQKAPEGRASPPSLKAQPPPIVVPPPAVVLPPPPLLLAAAPVAGLGSETSLGSAQAEGPGTGSGGEGTGTGAGGRGAGSGEEVNGPKLRTRRIRGGISTSSDYPRAAEQAGAEGVVVARLSVSEKGRVTDCRIRSSSGNGDLDRTTCRLILKRFRFLPARDSSGAATTDTVEWEQQWSLSQDGSPQAAEAGCRARVDKAASKPAREAEILACMAALGWRR